MPSYGEVTVGAAAGLYRASRRPEHDIRIMSNCSSLLTANMNGLWAWALNVGRSSGCTYFAMLHADIEPQEWWLDSLIDELEARKLDVLGVVAPIKDARGVTSIAMARPDLDPWTITGRLTMHEVHRLPETFTSEDLGFPLLLNTGCWVCRFDEAWAKKVRFTVNDRIAFDPNQGIYFAQVEPEDWYISRLWHELGLKIGATRKVSLGHRGTMSFSNTQAWGTNDYDREYLKDSVLRADWFPEDISGWLTHDEGHELARLAAGNVCLEIGSYCGKSTVCLAKTAKSVLAVDPFDGRGTAAPADTFAKFSDNLRRYDVAHKVGIRRGTSAEILPTLPAAFDLVFIDGAHDYQSVRADIEAALAVLKPGGLLAFHDYRYRDEGVTRAVDELLAGGASLLSRTDSLAVVNPTAVCV
jgi:SAM-dependent methyltransferase